MNGASIIDIERQRQTESIHKMRKIVNEILRAPQVCFNCGSNDFAIVLIVNHHTIECWLVCKNCGYWGDFKEYDFDKAL